MNLNDQLYLLALVYSNDLRAVNKVLASRNMNVDINFEFKIPLKKDAENLIDMINDLLLIAGDFRGLNDLILKSRLFRFLLRFNKIEQLTPSNNLKICIQDLLIQDIDEEDEELDDTYDEDLGWDFDLSLEDYYSISLLKVSVIMEYKEMVNLLLYYGSTITPIETDELHSIHLALYQNNTHILKMLLSQLSERDIKNNSINRLFDNSGLNPLHIAIFNQNNEAIDALVMVGADVNYNSKTAGNTLIWALESLDLNENMLLKVLSMGADPNYMEQVGRLTPLGVAILINRPDLVKVLAKNGANLNQSFGEPSTTPIKYSIDSNNKKILEILIEAGVDININIPKVDQHLTGTDLLQNPLLNAISLNNEEIVNILLKNGAYPHPIPSTSYSPLCAACVVNNKNIVQSFLNYNADPTVSSTLGNTPLAVCLFLVKFI